MLGELRVIGGFVDLEKEARDPYLEEDGEAPPGEKVGGAATKKCKRIHGGVQYNSAVSSALLDMFEVKMMDDPERSRLIAERMPESMADDAIMPHMVQNMFIHLDVVPALADEFERAERACHILTETNRIWPFLVAKLVPSELLVRGSEHAAHKTDGNIIGADSRPEGCICRVYTKKFEERYVALVAQFLALGFRMRECIKLESAVLSTPSETNADTKPLPASRKKKGARSSSVKTSNASDKRLDKYLKNMIAAARATQNIERRLEAIIVRVKKMRKLLEKNADQRVVVINNLAIMAK